jgi:hypothetical protein
VSAKGIGAEGKGILLIHYKGERGPTTLMREEEREQIKQRGITEKGQGKRRQTEGREVSRHGIQGQEG